MEFSLSCLLKWIMYVLAVITVILAIATITLDQNDQKSDADKVNQAGGTPGESHTGRNVFLMLIMLASAAVVVLHYFWPRLFLIVRFISKLNLPNTSLTACLLHRC